MSLDLDRSTWTHVRFGDVVKNRNETVRDTESLGIDRVIAMEHLDPGELKINSWGDTADGTTFTRRVRPGQTLFGKRRAYQRKAAFAEFGAICSGDILVFEADPTHLLPTFLPFLVQSEGFYNHALGTSAGSLSPRTNWKDLAKYEFDLPPLAEQERIAGLLWSVEHSIRSQRKLVSTAEAVAGPLMSATASDEVVVADVVRLARSGGTPSRSNRGFFGGEIPWLKSGEVVGDAIGEASEAIPEAALSACC
ncbi:MAG: hypothetical protein HHJ13_13435 [Phycicoccus sp.]|nr:hypothetical protein [Phycicoccus sp.]